MSQTNVVCDSCLDAARDSLGDPDASLTEQIEVAVEVGDLTAESGHLCAEFDETWWGDTCDCSCRPKAKQDRRRMLSDRTGFIESRYGVPA